MKAPLPTNEASRLEALRALDVLDTVPEASFDRITRLASRMTQTPIVLVSLVDSDRQWFKSRVGLDATETPREYAFCAHTILSHEVMVVRDAAEDGRFFDNPLVTGGPKIRFYAGAPLTLRDGHRIGTLCAIDVEPREMSDEAQADLADLAALVVDELDLRKRVAELRAAKRQNEESAAQLERANARLEHFAFMAAHDLRSPLKQIINLIDLIDPPDADPTFEMMRRSAQRMEELVGGYGRLARMTLDRGTLQGVGLASLVSSAVEDSGAAAPDITGNARLRCDPGLISQVFVNLLSNARKYGADGPVRVDIESTDEAVRVRVSNPVSEALNIDDTVFAPFRRLTRDGDGSGMGLAIVDRVVQLHGGHASASCRDRRFTVELTFPPPEALAA